MFFHEAQASGAIFNGDSIPDFEVVHFKHIKVGVYSVLDVADIRLLPVCRPDSYCFGTLTTTALKSGKEKATARHILLSRMASLQPLVTKVRIALQDMAGQGH